MEPRHGNDEGGLVSERVYLRPPWSARIVGGPWEGEADGGRRLRQCSLDAFESAHDGGQAAIQVVRLGGNAQPLDQGLAAAQRAELQIGAAGIERHHDAAVVIKWHKAPALCIRAQLGGRPALCHYFPSTLKPSTTTVGRSPRVSACSSSVRMVRASPGIRAI